jgi:hypothetical protein
VYPSGCPGFGYEEDGLGDTYWVALAEDNSIPRPEPDPESGFWSMYHNASPVIVPTDEGDDALCLFSTEGGVISYLRRAEQEGLIGGAKAFSISGREDFREVLARYPVHYVVVDHTHGQAEDTSVTVEEFLDRLED